MELVSDSAVTDKEVQIVNKWFFVLKETMLFWINTENGVASLIFLTYVTYHLISKFRGNEKNIQQNDFGIALAVLGLLYYSVYFTDTTTYSVIDGKSAKWYENHDTLYLFIIWTSEISYLLYHWFFNLRYVKSTFRLPILQKSAEFFSEMLDRIIKQREEQHAVFTPQELETHTSKMVELKKRQRKQERWANAITGVFLLLVAGSAYSFVYVAINKTVNFFFVPIYLLLNATMLIAVLVMRFVIKKTPNLLLNENLVVVLVLLFTATTASWIIVRW